MNAIQKAIQDIKFHIPNRILQLAFLSRYNGSNLIPPTIDEQIEKLVIKAKVLVDINLVGGVAITLPVDKCYQEIIPYNPTANYMIINVPYELTDGRDILSALSLTYYMYSQSQIYAAFGTNGGLKLTEKAFDSIDPNVGGFSTTNLELIGPNTILVHENLYTGIGGYLRVMVEYDENLNALNPRTFINFSKLCIYATKMFIHNELVVELNRGYIQGGYELNKIQEIIEEYKDAEEQYYDFLENVWRKISFMNDTESYSRYIKSLINPVL